jgi:ubiquinone/menaquinone biosynthesis C-methylase UbiE
MLNRRTTRTACVSLLWLAAVGSAEVSAQLGQRPAEEYISLMDRPGRVASLRVEEIIELLKLEPGDVVADIGSGSGAFSIPMAKAIGPDGVLYAVDIDQEMIAFVVNKAKEAGLDNVRGVLGEYADPVLPTREVDLAFLHSTLHMIEQRQAYVNALAKYLAPDGRIVVIETEPENARNWMWLRRSDVDTWMAALSFYPAEAFDTYENRWFVVYQRPYGDSTLLQRGNRGAP